MKKKITYWFLTVGIVVLAILGFVGFGLYRMEIEDHYGDLQEVFHASKSGDIIVNKTTKEYGIVEKTWKRLNIRTRKKDSTDLYNWVFHNGQVTNVEIYRSQGVIINVNQVDYDDIWDLIKEHKLKGVFEY